MSHNRRMLGRPTRWILLWMVLVLIVYPAGLVLLYQSMRSLTLYVGEIGDGPFVSGFHTDEADLTYRYRWTRGQAAVEFPWAGSAAVERVEVWAQTLAEKSLDEPQSITATLSATPLGNSEVSGDMRPYTFTVGRDQGSNSALRGGTVRIGIVSETFRPPGDARNLGVKIDRVSVHQSREEFNIPPAGLTAWGALALAGLFLLSYPLPRVMRTAVTVAGVLLLLTAIAIGPSFAIKYLPVVAVLLLAVGAVAFARPWRHQWPEVADRLGYERLARTVMAGLLLVYGVIALWTLLQVDWIGHADYAENAVVARNFVQGRGLTVDYVAQFYKDYPGISHPAETWPLLQPLMIAPFFLLFGPETWAAKLPNLFVMLALAWAVYHVGTRLFDPRAGLLAGAFTLSHPYFFNSVLYPINDLIFSLLFLLLAWVVWLRLQPVDQRAAGDAPASFRLRDAAVAGVLAGLLVWSKPSGAVLVLGVILWAVWTWRKQYLPRGVQVPWRAVRTAGGVAALVLLPLLIRNVLAFGVPFYTTESLDASILRYWNGDQTLWERIYKVYVGQELPHPRWIIGGKFGYDNLFDAIGRNFSWVWQRGVLGSPGEGDYVFGLLPLAGAVVGLGAVTRRAGNLLGLVGLCLGLYFAFVLVYWHFEGRYFQVAVPWLYLLLAWGLLWLWDRLRQGLREGVGRQFGLILLPVAVATILAPNLEVISRQIGTDTRPIGYVSVLKWIAANSTASDVVMTRDPWELNWHSGRRAVMIPYDDFSTIEETARRYGVTMMQLGGPVDRVDDERCPADISSGGPFPTGSRPALGALYCGVERPGYRLVFKQGGGTIYRLEQER